MRNPLRTARVSAAIAIAATVLMTAAPASAGTNGIRLFFSAPFVQGPSYSGADVSLEDFNGFPQTPATGCVGSSAVGTISVFCSVYAGDSSGGATVTSDTPTVGGSPSQYAATPWPSGGNEITVTFPEPVQYIGFWWSAGNVESGGGTTNFIEFYNGDQLLTTMTANRVMEVLGGGVPNPYPGSVTLTSEGGTTYPVGYYYGDPTGHSSVTPSSKSTVTGDYPFVFLNLFTKGATRVDRIVIGGDGFEFDNLTTSALEKTPTNDMVFVNEYSDDVTDAGGGSGGGSGSGGASDSEPLAATGFNAVSGLVVGIAAAVAGVAALVARRRRRP